MSLRRKISKMKLTLLLEYYTIILKGRYVGFIFVGMEYNVPKYVFIFVFL